MRTYIYCTILILAAGFFSAFVPVVLDLAQANFTLGQIPQNSSQVAGAQIMITPPYSLGVKLPEISAKAVLIKDLVSGTTLYQKDSNQKLPIASTTKIMTALLSSEYFQSNSTLKVNDGYKVEGSKMGLSAGETLNFRSLLYGMLLNSGNDAAYTIAENYPGGVMGFVSGMNKKAQSLNLANTHFDNPAGFDSAAHYSSAQDLSVITEEALKNSQLARIFATKETSVSSLDKKYSHPLKNLNKLLSSLNGVLGVKTGYTELAKENLVTLIDRNDHKILTVVLGSDDRFGDTTKLVEWAYSSFYWP